MKWMRFLLLTLVLGVLFGGCYKTEEKYPTSWMRVQVVSVKSGGIIGGPRKDIYHVKIGRRWVRLGSGNYTGHSVLADGAVVLYDLSDNKGLHIIREGERKGRPVAEVFAPGHVRSVPYRDELDIFDCRVRAEPAGCREVVIHRYDLEAKLLATFEIVRPEAYSDCQLLKIEGYDRDYIPYVRGQCKMNSPQAKCVLMASRPDGLFVHAVRPDEPWIRCSSPPPGVPGFMD
jgi:hypothetical protein